MASLKSLRRLASVSTGLRKPSIILDTAPMGECSLSHSRALSGLAASRAPTAFVDTYYAGVHVKGTFRSWSCPRAAHESSLGYLVQLLPRRHMAAGQGQQKGVVAPAHTLGVGGNLARQMTVSSPNVIREPYAGPAPLLQIADLTSRTGLNSVYNRVVGKLRNVYTLAKVKKDVPNWTLAGFKNEVASLYKLISEGIAAGKLTDVRRHVTEVMGGELKRQVKDRQAGGWDRVQWELVSVDQVSVVQGRLAVPSGMGTDVAFAQFTVEFESQQRFAAYDSKGALVAGSLEKVIPVRELWVFERSLVAAMPNKAWRLAGRLAVGKR